MPSVEEKPYDREDVAINRIKYFNTGIKSYYVAFSGGKDSIVMYDLVKRSGITNYIVEYKNTTVDPPDLIYFIRKNYQEVKIVNPKMSMWQLIEKKKMPPTRLVRYCCEYLKEDAGNGHIVVTGIRAQESKKRAQRKMFEACTRKRDKYYLNPIIDWTEDDIWNYIRKYKLPYPNLYDKGWRRIGCVGCPMAGKHRLKEFAEYPKIKQNYIRAFDRMLKNRIIAGLDTKWKTGEEVMAWWLNDKESGNGQMQFMYMDNL
jgi:phosphoadenosine phosphosulfate reductase